MALKPLSKSFLFSFMNDTYGGQFVEKNRGVIQLTNQDLSTQATLARWGMVEAIGELVTDIKVGDIVLIEALMWTKELKYEGVSYWKSDVSKVLAIGEDESVTFTY
jgi:hypothetical protein